MTDEEMEQKVKEIAQKELDDAIKNHGGRIGSKSPYRVKLNEEDDTLEVYDPNNELVCVGKSVVGITAMLKLTAMGIAYMNDKIHEAGIKAIMGNN